MGFTLRFLLGLIFVLSISSSKSASTWRRMNLLSQEPSTLQPLEQSNASLDLNNSNEEEEEEEEHKPKTEETNKIVSVINSKEGSNSIPVELKLDRPHSVTENDLSKESSESTKSDIPKLIDLDIAKYISPEFHDQNNIYKLQTSPAIEKYINLGNESQSSLVTTTTYDFDKKFQTTKEDIEKKLEYIDDKSLKSSVQYIEPTESVAQSDLSYKNASYVSGNKVHKDEEIESGVKLDYASSYNHMVIDQQKHSSSSETFLEKPKVNETDSQNKIFRELKSPDPEVLPEKLNQTERRTALLSNKIEHDNDNRRSKWSFQYPSTTVAYMTTPGQKEEIMFVPYTKEMPISISKRGSTKFIDTVTTQKQTKMLDEAAVENQVYPVQVPAPNEITKEEKGDIGTLVVPTSTEDTFVKTTLSVVPDKNSTTEESITLDLTMTTSNSSTTTLNSSKTIVGTTTEVITSLNPFTLYQENSTGTTELPTLNTTLVKVTEELTTVTVASKLEDTNTTVPDEVTTITTTAFENVSTTENVSEASTHFLGITTTEEISTVSESIQPIVTPMKNSTEETPTVTQTDSTTLNEETVPSVQVSTISTLPTVQVTVIEASPSSKIEENTTKVEEDPAMTTVRLEDRTSTVRDVKNTSNSPETTVDYNDNVIKQGDVITSTTEHSRKDIPMNTARPINRNHYPIFASSSERNSYTSESSYSDETDEGIGGGKIAAIVISCIGAVCFVILAILLLVMRKRHKRFNYGQRCTPVSLDAYSVDNVSAYNSVRRKGMMRASKRSYGNPAFEESSVTHLLNFPELMKFGRNTEAITSEYDDIPQISVQTNELPEGCETKNRYANVIPLPESRVYLSTTEESPNSDYINANFVTGPKSVKNYYIACQAPMQSTVDDFWKMIWEQQSRVVLMLTHLFENGAEKCFDYLPPSEVLDCHRLFGDYQITLKKREVKEKYVISNLQLKNMVSNTWREVTHLWYLGWPERGVPLEESSLVAFLIEARSYVKAVLSENGKVNETTPAGLNTSQPQTEHNPIVVHCSPGTGRTGTVIACDIAIREFELTRQVDIPKTVYQIRRNRAGAVQTKEQYAYIYRVITWYANKLTGGVLDSY